MSASLHSAMLVRLVKTGDGDIKWDGMERYRRTGDCCRGHVNVSRALCWLIGDKVWLDRSAYCWCLSSVPVMQASTLCSMLKDNLDLISIWCEVPDPLLRSAVLLVLVNASRISKH